MIFDSLRLIWFQPEDVKFQIELISFTDKRLDFIILVSLSALIILSRVPFMSKVLYDWDSVGFALAFQNYDIALHQPQPPGYILYVAFGKVVNVIFNDPNSSMIFISIFFSVLTVMFIYFLAKQMFSRKFALVASIILVFNPIFWFYGEISTIYMNEAFFATLIAYTSYQVLKGNNRFFYISAIVLGIAGGFRQDIVFFMLPLWLFCISHENMDTKRLSMALIILVASVMLWLLPTVMLAGGYENYSIVSKELLTGSFSINSIFFGADITENLSMGMNLITWSLIGMGVVNVFILIIYIFYRFKTNFKLSNLKNLKIIFLVLWIFPAFIFYFLFHFGKPGYILVYLPAFALIFAYVYLNISYHLNIRFGSVSKNSYLILILLLCILSGILQFTNPSELRADYGRIYTEDLNFQYMNNSLDMFNSNDTIIFSDNEDNWRKLTYYFPEYEAYSYYVRISNGKIIKGLRHYKNNRTEIYESEIREIHMNSSTTKIFWSINNSAFLNDLKAKIDIKTVDFPDGKKIYYSDVKNDTAFQIYNFVFKKD